MFPCVILLFDDVMAIHKRVLQLAVQEASVEAFRFHIQLSPILLLQTTCTPPTQAACACAFSC